MNQGLQASVSRAVPATVMRLDDVRREPVAYDTFLAGRSVVRVRGLAVTPDGAVPWSMIEKVTDGPEVASPYLYDNGLREFRAYESGLLDDLAPGLVAPMAHGLDEGTDGRLTLWLEDLGGERRLVSDADILGAARDLGRLTGRWMGRVPRRRWLFTGWIDRHAQPEAIAPALTRLRSVRSPSAIKARLGWEIEEAIELIELQPALGPVLNGLPRTLCHHDAVAANVFRRPGDGDGEDETVLIDWEMAGPGPVGADLVSLLFSSARRGDMATSVMTRLLPAAFEAYADGMRDAGAPVDAGVLRLAFHAAVALRWSLARDVIVALDGGGPVFRGSAPDESREEALDELIALSHVLLESAVDARRAIEHVPPST